MYMNKKTSEKSHRIYLRVSQNEKNRITELANSCGLSVAEYLRKRALGYAVKAVAPDAFYIFNERLSELLNCEMSPETEAKALKLFDDIVDKSLLARRVNIVACHVIQESSLREEKPFQQLNFFEDFAAKEEKLAKEKAAFDKEKHSFMSGCLGSENNPNQKQN